MLLKGLCPRLFKGCVLFRAAVYAVFYIAIIAAQRLCTGYLRGVCSLLHGCSQAVCTQPKGRTMAVP
eukprot:510761-Lingulodinium_polyedra.AAC.1